MSLARRCHARTTLLCPVYGSVPGYGRISGAHGPEKRVSGVLFPRVSKPGGTRTCRDAQSEGPKVGISHSSQVPAYKTHLNTTCFESDNLIVVPGLRHCVHTAQSQLSSPWQTGHRHRVWAEGCTT